MSKAVLVVAGAVATVLMTGMGGLAGPGASGAVTHRGPGQGTQLWVQRYNGPGNGEDRARSVTVSPDGRVVFVTGKSSSSPGAGYGTIAYLAATGAVLWHSGNDGVAGSKIAVSPDGTAVFVAGSSPGGTGNRVIYTTVAYAAATGARLWEHRYTGGGTRTGSASAMAVSPGGGRVVVSGTTAVAGGSSAELTTMAYRAVTGDRLWVKKYSSRPANHSAGVSSVKIGPDGRSVFVAGTASGHCVTVAYRAATGAGLWAQRFPIRANGAWATSLAVSPAGDRVFVAGYAYNGALGSDYFTVAYGAASGVQVWHQRYNGPGSGNDYAYAVAVSPNGKTVYVSGNASTRAAVTYATVAYRAATGARLWASLHNPGEYSFARAMALSPDGTRLFVTGYSYLAGGYHYATIACNAVTGAWLWTRRYTGPGSPSDIPRSIAVSPGGGSVFITGTSFGSSPAGTDYATIAYAS